MLAVPTSPAAAAGRAIEPSFSPIEKEVITSFTLQYFCCWLPNITDPVKYPSVKRGVSNKDFVQSGSVRCDRNPMHTVSRRLEHIEAKRLFISAAERGADDAMSIGVVFSLPMLFLPIIAVLFRFFSHGGISHEVEYVSRPHMCLDDPCQVQPRLERVVNTLLPFHGANFGVQSKNLFHSPFV